MNALTNRYASQRYPPKIISHAVWLYHRVSLSVRDVEDLLAARGVIVSYEATLQRCLKFGQSFPKSLRHHQGRPGDSWFLEEACLANNGRRHNPCRGVDQDGDVPDILVQKRREKRAAKRFLRKLLRGLR